MTRKQKKIQQIRNLLELISCLNIDRRYPLLDVWELDDSFEDMGLPVLSAIVVYLNAVILDHIPGGSIEHVE